MSKRIPAKYKAELGELLADWYRHFGLVAPRRAYHEDDDESSGGRASNKMFEDHPFLVESPIGAPSDLSSILVEDGRTLDEANDRKDELKNELKHKLDLKLNNTLRNTYSHKFTPPTLQPF